MTSEEYAQFRRDLGVTYAAGQVRAGVWSADEAVEQSERQLDELLPDGLETAGMLLLVGESDGEVVGFLWTGPVPGQSRRWWIYDVRVVAEHQGKGHGRGLVRAAERAARERNAESIGLNVFGDNAVARNLYESEAYRAAALLMRKDLT